MIAASTWAESERFNYRFEEFSLLGGLIYEYLTRWKDVHRPPMQYWNFYGRLNSQEVY